MMATWVSTELLLASIRVCEALGPDTLSGWLFAWDVGWRGPGPALNRALATFLLPIGVEVRARRALHQAQAYTLQRNPEPPWLRHR